MKKYIDEILSNDLIFVDSSSLMAGQKDFFFLDFYSVLKKNDKKILILDIAIDEIEKKMNYAETKIIAEEAKEIIEHYKKEELMILADTANHTKLDALDAASRQKSCALICEDKDFIKEINAIALSNNIALFKISSGNLNKWEKEKSVKQMNNYAIEIEKPTNPLKGSKLLISIVLDNSASMKGSIEFIEKSVICFNKLLDDNGILDLVEYSITCFNGFECKKVKRFDDYSVKNLKISAKGIPFVNMAVNDALDALMERKTKIEKIGKSCYKPWLLLLLNGENYGDVNEAVEKIKNEYSNGNLTLFPFALSENEFDKSLLPILHLKKNIVIKDKQYDDLFKWLFNLASKRVCTPVNQSFGIDPKSYEGWTIK